MSSTSNGKSTSGVNIALAGLAFQVATLVVFSAFATDYVIRSRSVWTSVRWPREFQIFIGFLIAATTLILIRCSYRVYELSQGYSRDSVALRDQPLFIGLESVYVITPFPPSPVAVTYKDQKLTILDSMVVLAAYCLIGAHPGFVFKTSQDRLTADHGTTEKYLHSQDSSADASREPTERV